LRRLPMTNYRLPPEILQDIPWFRQHLLGWFKVHGRLFPWREQGKTPYEILVAEILLQRTVATNAARAYQVFLQRYPSWTALAQAPLNDLQELLKPVGLWQQKAKVFQSLACSVERHGGTIPTSRQELEQLEGVGQYIASVILTTVYGKEEPFIDVNLARLLERFFGARKLADIRDDPYLQTLSRLIVAGEQTLQCNWAILDFAALVCKGTPLCPICPLQEKCLFFSARREHSIRQPEQHPC
jgi:A/G-specific adenine glycosylase